MGLHKWSPWWLSTVESIGWQGSWCSLCCSWKNLWGTKQFLCHQCFNILQSRLAAFPACCTLLVAAQLTGLMERLEFSSPPVWSSETQELMASSFPQNRSSQLLRRPGPFMKLSSEIWWFSWICNKCLNNQPVKASFTSTFQHFLVKVYFILLLNRFYEQWLIRQRLIRLSQALTQ